jgi:hypothetical protein
MVERSPTYWTSSQPTICARTAAHLPALCGRPPGSPWTTVRAYLTCSKCIDVVASRLAARAKS